MLADQPRASSSSSVVVCSAISTFSESIPIRRQALHARSLEVTHPVTGEAIRFEAPLPEDFRQVLECLRRSGGPVGA